MAFRTAVFLPVPWTLVAATGLALSATHAAADIDWITQIGFSQTPDGPLISASTLTLTATGTYTFYVRAGIYNLTGLSPVQSNQGLNDWKATVAAAGLQPGESIGLNQSTARISPFDFGPSTSFGGTAVPPGSITNVDCARDLSGSATAPWLWNTTTGAPGPAPTGPTVGALGADSLVNVWRFNITIAALGGGPRQVTFTGRAGPIVQWLPFTNMPPTPTDPGIQSFLGLTPDPVLHDYTPTSLTILVPSPGPGGVVLIVGPALAAATGRRRRHRA